MDPLHAILQSVYFGTNAYQKGNIITGFALEAESVLGINYGGLFAKLNLFPTAVIRLENKDYIILAPQGGFTGGVEVSDVYKKSVGNALVGAGVYMGLDVLGKLGAFMVNIGTHVETISGDSNGGLRSRYNANVSVTYRVNDEYSVHLGYRNQLSESVLGNVAIEQLKVGVRVNL